MGDGLDPISSAEEYRRVRDQVMAARGFRMKSKNGTGPDHLTEFVARSKTRMAEYRARRRQKMMPYAKVFAAAYIGSLV